MADERHMRAKATKAFTSTPMAFRTVCDGDWDNCELQVVPVETTASFGGLPIGLVLIVIVALTSIWVLVDAGHIGARPGLGLGLFDMGPGGWFASCLFFWIIAFPTYLSSRKTIRTRVETLRQWGWVPLLRPGSQVQVRGNDNLIYSGRVQQLDLQGGRALVAFDRGGAEWVGSFMVVWAKP